MTRSERRLLAATARMLHSHVLGDGPVSANARIYELLDALAAFDRETADEAGIAAFGSGGEALR